MRKFKIACWADSERLFHERDSILCREDCEILLASSPRELLDLANRAQPALMIIERRAGEDWLDLCRSLKSGRRTSELPLVAICEDAREESALRDLGVEEILVQPDDHALAQSVARVLGLGVREHPRYVFEAPARVVLEGRDHPLTSRTVDLSVQGAQLEIDHPLPLHSTVRLVVLLPSEGGELELQARVVRIMADPVWSRNRLGLRFLPLETLARNRLEALVEDLAQEEIVHRRSSRQRTDTRRDLF